MDIRYYQEAVKRTCATTEDKETAKMALVGMPDELGELVDPVLAYLFLQRQYAKLAGPAKKELWHKHERLPLPELIDEVGDFFWYATNFVNALELDLEEILQHNVEKLQKRYPEGFDSERSIHRE